MYYIHIYCYLPTGGLSFRYGCLKSHRFESELGWEHCGCRRGG